MENFLNYDVLCFFLILANSADPDKMQHNAAFHLGIHGLSKYPVRAFLFIKG